MGVDYVTSIVWGVEVNTPLEIDDEDEWIEDLLFESNFSCFTAGSSWDGEVTYAIGIGSSLWTRGGSGWSPLEEPSLEQRQEFELFLKSKNINEQPGWLFGLHIC